MSMDEARGSFFKKLLIGLIAVNALLVLVVVMNQNVSFKGVAKEGFKQQGAYIELIESGFEQSSKVVKDVCYELGVFESFELAGQVSRRLFARNIDNKIVEREEVVSTDYWVIIPPMPSEKQAYRLLKQLQLSNIDSYMVTQGEYANAISLGLFTIRASAYRIKDKMVNSGFDVVVQNIDRTQKRFWVQYSEEAKGIKVALNSLGIKYSNKICESR